MNSAEWPKSDPMPLTLDLLPLTFESHSVGSESGPPTSCTAVAFLALHRAMPMHAKTSLKNEKTSEQQNKLILTILMPCEHVSTETFFKMLFFWGVMFVSIYSVFSVC